METNLSRLLDFLPALVLVGFMIGCGGNITSENKSPEGGGKKDLKAKLENEPPQNAQSKKSTIPTTLQEAIGGFRLQLELKSERHQISFNQNANAWVSASLYRDSEVHKQGKVKITGLKVILIDDGGDEVWMKFASKNPQKGDKVELGTEKDGEEKWIPFVLVDITKHSAKSLKETWKQYDAFRKNFGSMRNAAQLVRALIGYEGARGQFPDSDKWCDAILRDAGTLAVFYSPQHPDTAKLKELLPEGKRVSHYSLNKVMSGKDSSNPEMVLVFECDLGWNGAGGLEDALKHMEKHKLEKIAVATADGAARAVTKEELKKLKWEIAP